MSLLARLLLALLLVAQGAAAEVVRFPRPESESDRRFDYAIDLLKLALSKVGPDYRVELAESAMNQERQILELEAGRKIDVAPMPSSAEREARLLAVYIPITRGVLGLRLGLVRQGDAARFASVNALEDLKRELARKLKAGYLGSGGSAFLFRLEEPFNGQAVRSDRVKLRYRYQIEPGFDQHKVTGLRALSIEAQSDEAGEYRTLRRFAGDELRDIIGIPPSEKESPERTPLPPGIN